ncbi:Imm10 family immunity protein [Luteolibacter flavescens]|uniref:Imm10 family immunity protein n=1 Tax=Luteolibacter flavescens TaxID=1859460 RepID=A0ABT3FKL3_9BACT|nr:Imm10 family immunity protein [Luteolibacter flavescens]MCW1884097.1 Imm10 family immunity protein [Luteolibacter flavescens]
MDVATMGCRKEQLPMNRSFKATCFHVEDMGEFLVVGLADHKFETVDYLTFQRSHEFDQQDIEQGMDAVHVERNDQGHSGYAGIRGVHLFPDRLHIHFDESGMEFMDGLASTEVLFDFSGESFETLRAGLEQCFAGFGCFHDHTRGS